MDQEQQCPLCQRNNHCDSHSNTSCWCMDRVFPEEIFEKLSLKQMKQTCICPACIARMTEQLKSNSFRTLNKTVVRTQK